MRRTFSFVIVGMLALGASRADGQTLQSQTTWGAAGAEFAGGVAVASDGGSYLTGTSDSFGFDEFGQPEARIFLVKFSAAGAVEWQRVWNGSTLHGKTAVAVATDGSVYVTGLAFTNDSDAVLLKFSPAGALLWERTWGGDQQESGAAVAVAQDGSVYIGGRSTSFATPCDPEEPICERTSAGLFVVKFSSGGTLLWDRVVDNMIGEAITVAPDGNVYGAGPTIRPGSGFSQFDLVTVKLGPDGGLQWARRYAAGEVADARGGMAAASNSGSIAIAGALQAQGGGGIVGIAPLLLKIDAAGNLLFDRTWGGKNGAEGSGVAIASNGTTYVSGTTTGGAGGFQDAFVFNVLPNGKAGTAATWGGPGFEVAGGVAVTAGGTVVLGAQTTVPPPYALASAPRKVSDPHGDLSVEVVSVLDVVGIVTILAEGAAVTNGQTIYQGNSEAALIRFTP